MCKCVYTLHGCTRTPETCRVYTHTHTCVCVCVSECACVYVCMCVYVCVYIQGAEEYTWFKLGEWMQVDMLKI